MSTYNSVNYASDIQSPSTAAGLPSTDPRMGLMAQDAKINGAVPKKKFVEFNTANQALNSGDVLNVAILPPGARPIGIVVINDTGTTSATLDLAAVQGGTATAHYFSSSALSLASATRQEGFTNAAKVGAELAGSTTITATVGGANLTTPTLLKFIIEYLTN